MTNTKGSNAMSRSEFLVDVGGWLVIVGLAVEIVLALIFHGNDPWYEQWSLVLANAVIAGGVWVEIHFGGNVRAEANAREAEANSRAEAARLELEQLKAKVAWRRLTQEQRDSLVASLKGHKMKLWLAHIGDNPESTLFRNDVDAALRAADIEASGYSGVTVSVGISITQTPGMVKEHNLLVLAFQKAGITLNSIQPVNFLGKTELAIIVGSLPPPS